MLCERKLDVPKVAKQITDVFAGGIREVNSAPKKAPARKKPARA
jgi:hypothetical protein